jgi:hypothetical protein
MIEEFDHERLLRRRHFLESRARAHVNAKGDHRWHRTVSATLLRDAAAVALLLDEFEGARELLRRSGNQLLQLGLSGGLQLLFIADTIDGEEGEIGQRIDTFAQEFFQKETPEGPQRLAEHQFDKESFRPPQLLRAYQGLAGRRSDDAARASLRRMMRAILTINASMPVGATRIPVAIYLAVFDYLANRETEEANLPGGFSQIIRSLAQRRAELLSVARQDHYHWKALLRPSELIDLDLLAMFVAGRRRGQNFGLVMSAFAERDPLTALPVKLAIALSQHS